jgi:lipopolysaccharide/colanic/teichoic acid biosynthesis glycosyltransferase
MKRIFDIFFSLIGLIALSPLFLIVALLVKLDNPGPVFFRQERIGKNFSPFLIYKFRTMTADARERGPLITVSGDTRITRIGKILRKYKIDELPQLINVFKGEMSLVGPRPEVKKYVEMFRSDYGKLLVVPPGITDPASINYSAEEGVLSQARDNWEDEYVKKVLPEKIRLSLQYAGNHNLLVDAGIILETIFKVLHIRKRI